MPRVIRQNDPTGHGGKGVGASANCLVMGLPVARAESWCDVGRAFCDVRIA